MKHLRWLFLLAFNAWAMDEFLVLSEIGLRWLEADDVLVPKPHGMTTSAAAGSLVRAKPVVSNFRVVTGRARLELGGNSGDGYQVLASSNLVDWIVLRTVTNQAGQTQFGDAQPAMLLRCFYRARLEG